MYCAAAHSSVGEAFDGAEFVSLDKGLSTAAMNDAVRSVSQHDHSGPHKPVGTLDALSRPEPTTVGIYLPTSVGLPTNPDELQQVAVVRHYVVLDVVTVLRVQRREELLRTLDLRVFCPLELQC
jgi:hypothetical protein